MSTGLDAALQIRVDRAKVKLAVTAGDIQAWRIVERPPECVEGVDVFTLIKWMPPLAGARRVPGLEGVRILRAARVPSHRRLVDLTDAQRQRLSFAIQQHLHPSERGIA